MQTIRERIRRWGERKANEFEKNLDEKGYSEEKKEHIRWAYGYFWDRIFLFIGALTCSSILNGTEGLIFGIAGCVVMLLAGLLTRGKSDSYIIAAAFFFLAVASLNWFFDDWKKTLAFPLAYLFYRIGKHLSPDLLQRVFTRVESHFLWMRKAGDILREAAEEINPNKEKGKGPISGLRKKVGKHDPESRRRPLWGRKRPFEKGKVHIGKSKKRHSRPS